ncbi:Trypsin-like cysteine/serine peptidase domain-containing protein [Quillaja saponaria]|uniref:Trypsin-like cysteine/serine peptidase domain-containing protein n=1 Tax=Quillaja saponaria TaxID=32244 RepID=A0AAD7PN20_QUISA|nr:Trypsin-like cysteine/serine peptidase domain-containing protein [Quillaja saponaria]
MGGLRESWCFCKGVSKSERMKVAICSGKGHAMARISGAANGVYGTGFLIHRNLLLTTHANLPSVVAAESSEIRLQNAVAASLFPHRFFVTSSVLDLTIVGLDALDGDANAQGQHPQCLKTCSKPSLELGSVVYLLGYTAKQELTIGEGKVVIATENLIKLSTDGVIWNPGSAGFDVQGNLAFMICDPMKLATSPNTKSSSTSSSSSSSWKKDHSMQFGIPIPVICDWLNQHWEGSLDELSKPKLPLIRLMSTGQKSEHSCASFSLRQVFKSTEADNDGTPTSSYIVSKTRDEGPSCPAGTNMTEEHTLLTDLNAIHVQGIPTPDIYESPRLTAVPLRKKKSGQIQLLDINFPPRIAKPAVLPQPAKQLHPESDENSVKEPLPDNMSSSPIEVSEMHNGRSSEVETMYSAETAESRNYKSPREVKFQQVGRSQSCVSYNRWGAAQRNPAAHRAMQDKQRGLVHDIKMYSQGATSQRSNEYFSPTVASIMKKRNSLEQPNRPRQSPVHSSPRWMF